MIEVDDYAVDAMLAEDPGGPVVMLNLLRFRTDGGRERYWEYVQAMQEKINVRYGVEIQYAGDGGTAVVADDGQAWDMVALVRYPSRQTFAEMVRSEDYAALAPLRNQALAESVLQPTVPLPVG